MSFIGSLIGRYMKREGAKHSLAEWPVILEKSARKVTAHFQGAADTTKNRELGRHTIGIERWSQSRLRVFLGGELVMDEYDGYQPAADLTTAALAEEFAETRRATVELARQLVDAGIPDTQTVPHNDMGDAAARTWLAYITGHALRESGRMK